MYPRQGSARGSSEWNAPSNQPPSPSWSSGHHHHPYSSHAHPSIPPPIHYPVHHRQQGGYHQYPQSYYSRSPATQRIAPDTTRSMPHSNVIHRSSGSTTPAVVSPSAGGGASSISSPVSKAATPSPTSPRDGEVRIKTKDTSPSAARAVAPAVVPLSSAASAARVAAIAANSNLVTAKPPRPYTEYTMFYQLEREFILHRVLTDKDKSEQDPTENQPALFQNDPLMPERYRSLPLRADWYISGKSKKPTKRKHRKSHGKIGFLELTRMIAARWADVDTETRKYCKMMAAMELVKYKEDMESYNQYKERLAAIGEVPQDMKERLLKKQRMQEKKKDSEASKLDKEPGAEDLKDNAKDKTDGAVRPDPVRSSTTTARKSSRAKSQAAQVKLEPMPHNSPTANLDNDMEEFITSLVHSPKTNKSKKGKVITPDRSGLKKRRRPQLFRDRSSVTAAAAAAVGSEINVPLKSQDDDDHLDGIKMAFSGIDENEIEREFAPKQPVKMDPSFDYWDALVGV